MERITVSDLEAVVRRINRVMNGTDQHEPWERVDGTLRANVGVFYLDGAYGGYDLYRMVNESGGVDDVLRCGHRPKRELYDLMHAYLRGITSGIERVQREQVPA